MREGGWCSGHTDVSFLSPRHGLQFVVTPAGVGEGSRAFRPIFRARGLGAEDEVALSHTGPSPEGASAPPSAWGCGPSTWCHMAPDPVGQRNRTTPGSWIPPEDTVRHSGQRGSTCDRCGDGGWGAARSAVHGEVGSGDLLPDSTGGRESEEQRERGPHASTLPCPMHFLMQGFWAQGVPFNMKFLVFFSAAQLEMNECFRGRGPHPGP